MPRHFSVRILGNRSGCEPSKLSKRANWGLCHMALIASAIAVVPLLPSAVGAPDVSASNPEQVFPSNLRIHLPIGLALSAPINATGAPLIQTSTAVPPPSATLLPTITPTITPTSTMSGTATATPTLDATAVPTATEAIHVLLPEETFEDFPFDPIAIVAAAVDGDSIDMRVRYGGGCETHDIRLLAGREIMESYPPQADIRLSHDAHGDMCRALIYEDLRYDLTPLKSYY